MEKDYLKRDLDDIVFESRNRAYGAYQLRKSYGRNMQRASLWGIGICAFILVSPSLMDKLTAKRMDLKSEVVVLEDLVTPPPPPPAAPPPPPPPPPPKTMPTIRFVPPIVSNEVETEPPLPDLKDITAAISTATVDGDTSVKYVAPEPPAPVFTPEPQHKEFPQVVDFYTVEQKPQFPDGDKAMYKFLSENIKYPAFERENGIEGTVYVGFTIWTDGSIQNVTVRRSPSGGLSNEALRVVALMPKWSAGKQNGRAVPVSFTLPMKFRLD